MRIEGRGLGLSLAFPFGHFRLGDSSDSSLPLSLSDSLFLRAFFLPARSVVLAAMVGGADIDRGAGMFLFDGPR